ncbi:MAG: hypothetical protein ACP5JO_02115 [Candidatus Ratteibacteria bacterium]
MKPKIVLEFDTAEMIEIEKILLDNDRDAAVKYLRKLKNRIDSIQKAGCDPWKGQRTG